MWARAMRQSSVAAFVAIALSGGCAVGPNYRRPTVETPSRYGDPAATQPASTQVSAVEAGETPWVDWWAKLNDVELDSLVTRAVAANHELREATARVADARAATRVANSRLYPSIDIGAVMAGTRGSAAGFGFPYGAPGIAESVYQIGFDASYEVDVFGGIRRSVEAAGASAEAVEYDRGVVQLTLLGEVAHSYVLLRTLQRRLNIARQNLDDQRRTLDVVQRRLHNGVAATFDVVRARAEVEATEANIPPLEAGIRQTIYALSLLLGKAPLDLVSELSTDAPLPKLPKLIPIGLPSELLRRRPDVMSAERSLAAATALQGVAVADLFPHLILGGTAGVQSTRTDDLFSQHNPSSGYYLAGPSANWTLFDGGRRLANIDRSKAVIEAATAHYEEAVLGALRDVESSLTALSHDQARRDTLAAVVADAQEAVRIARNEYSNGLVDLLDVLEVQRTLYGAQDAQAQADLAVSTDMIGLFKALGGGWETPPTGAPSRPLAAADRGTP